MNIVINNPFRRNKELKFITKERKKSKQRKIFLITFIVFIILLFSGSFMYLLKTYDYDLGKVFGQNKDTTKQGEEKKEEKEQNKHKEKLKGRSKLLFSVCSNDGNEIYFTSIIDMNMDKVQVSVTCLPVELIGKVDGVDKSLQSSYSEGGATSLLKCARSCSNVDINKYIVIKKKNFKGFIRELGNFTLNLNHSISYNDDEFSINFIKGKQVIPGNRLLKYIIYQKKKGGAYLNAQSNIVCDMIDQMITSKNFNEEDNMYDELIKLVDSDISVVDYTKKKSKILAYVNSEKRKKSISVDLSMLKN